MAQPNGAPPAQIPQEWPTHYLQATQREPTFGELASRERGYNEPFFRYAAPDPNHPTARLSNTTLYSGSDLPYFGDWPAVSEEINYFRENNPAMITPGTPENDELQAWNAEESRVLWPTHYAEPSGEDIIRALMMAKAQQK